MTMSHNRQPRLRPSTYPRIVRSNELVFAFQPDNFGDGPMRCYVNSMSDRHHGLNRESLNALRDEVDRMTADMDAKEATGPNNKDI